MALGVPGTAGAGGRMQAGPRQGRQGRSRGHGRGQWANFMRTLLAAGCRSLHAAAAFADAPASRATPFVWYRDIMERTAAAEPVLHCYGVRLANASDRLLAARPTPPAACVLSPLEHHTTRPEQQAHQCGGVQEDADQGAQQRSLGDDRDRGHGGPGAGHWRQALLDASNALAACQPSYFSHSEYYPL